MSYKDQFKEVKINRITINGKTIVCLGTNVVINNGEIIVDGNIVQECNSGDIKVIIEGDVNKIDCGGSREVSGDVKGDIDAGGSVTCGNVSGDIDAGGSVRCRR